MTVAQMFIWGRTHGYPQLLIGHRVLRHGERAWSAFFLSATIEQLQVCAARIALWEYWAQAGRVPQEVRG